MYLSVCMLSYSFVRLFAVPSLSVKFDVQILEFSKIFESFTEIAAANFTTRFDFFDIEYVNYMEDTFTITDISMIFNCVLFICIYVPTYVCMYA